MSQHNSKRKYQPKLEKCIKKHKKRESRPNKKEKLNNSLKVTIVGHLEVCLESEIMLEQVDQLQLKQANGKEKKKQIQQFNNLKNNINQDKKKIIKMINGLKKVQLQELQQQMLLLI